MVANEIAGSGQVDVFLGGGSRWTTSSSDLRITSTCHTNRMSAVGVGSTASAPTTTPPGGDALNLSCLGPPHYAADRHRTTAAQGWTDTRPPSADIGPSETDEEGLPQHRSSSSSISRQSNNHSLDDCGHSAVHGDLSPCSSDAIRISVCSGLLDQSAHGEDLSASATEDVGAGVVNDALDAPQRPDDQQHDDKMPHQSSHYDCGSVTQQQQWKTEGDESNTVSTSPSGGITVGGVPLKSALKRAPAARAGGVAGSLQHLQSSRKKARVRFNEALNTFLECDYVIYVDDDEYDLLYHLDAVAAAAAQAEAELADVAATEQPQLVNVRSFELQLPETSLTSTCVSHATITPAAATTGDAGTLSPPDGYKDAAAFYAAAAALVDLENQHLSGFTDDGVDPWESEDYDDEEAMADEAEALDNGWADAQTADESPKIEANRQEHEAMAASDGSSEVADLAVPLPDPPRTGILKGGKLWRGAVNNNNNSNDSSQNNSSSASSSSGSSAIGGERGGGEEATLSRHGEKSPAVRFIHLNDSQGGGDSSEDGNSAAAATNAGGAASGGQSQRSAHHHSAFQQLFPRARKLLQELPEAEIQRLTTAARANNAPSSVSSSRAVTSLLSHSTDTGTDTTDAPDLKYEKALRVAEVTEEDSKESHPPSGGATAAAVRLGVQYSADYYQMIKRIRSASAAENARHQRKADATPPTAADSLVERLKWLTTTDVDDDVADDSNVAEEREAADGGSDLEMTAMQLAAYASVPAENVEQTQEGDAVAEGNQHQQAAAAPRSTADASSGSGEAANPPPALTKTSKSGSGGNEKSTYRKLNELFFRTKSKDKNKDANKSSNSALNRSFSPPPPAEVEPKMKPSKKQQQPHLIHIVGLSGKCSSSSAVSASASSGASGTETLGRIPNVVPTVDHVYRAAVDLVTRNSSTHQFNHAAAVHSGVVIQGPSSNDSYSLDDIDAALHAQMSASASSTSGVATEAMPNQCMYLLPASHRIPEDSRDETGGSRSSGSSGDSGLGSSHDTSLTGTDTDGSAQDELQAFVRQDATQGRIDRIKKRYSAALEDEAEDYGFLRRPSVRGIKTRFGSTSEIIQQMQAQLAGPMPAVSAARATGQTHVNWSAYAEQSSIQAEALLDPREKRRSAMMAMSNSVHLPALPEDAGYFHQQHQQLIHNAGRAAQTTNVMATNRPASVMNIYGSTGDLYQHLRAPMRPVMVRHPQSTSSSAMAGTHPAQLLERTSSVCSVSSAMDGSSVYGTIRRQPPQVMHPSYAHPDSISPTRDYVPAVMIQQHMAQQQQQHHLQQHHQMPLRMTVSTPGAPYASNPQQQRPVSQQMTAGSIAYYATAQDYALQQQQQFQIQQQQQQHYVYATLPGKRQSPYGVPATIPISAGSQVVTPTMLDPTRYRQVLPPMTSQVTLRPSSALAEPRYPSAVHTGHLQPPQQPAPPAPLKDEREGPEGASSSPGLTHHDVNM
ncbi:LOW QUALITY PROTEIN: uncharacterized protein LOC130687108 [Daphnia carinata]|uniref:LOW QUALITY PROTEIN: uncharacterized protein LOC130687108 n=1 Tax=Daphnia carinata TaxID=120202 RepID=UPI0025804123|nr:LOW QUALITY PROTEIN: uncharacterized protein LOC130687108 [Daphnia carinata]